ncbi:UDP-glucuronic acid decarboxylase family protein [Streptomyces sp. NPDC057743]|uniref:UDP-glucuronic acid decarboxylase family protein n=1 Tax=Streptomyces sp. NPDC057743 TaxID=3346236 RepID=UPI00368E304F
MRRRRRAVVTGGAGFLGSHLCERLLTEGFAVVCLDNLSTGRADNVAHLPRLGPFEFAQADATTGVPVAGEVDAVLHLASPAAPADYGRLPVETLKVGSLGTLHALELAREHRARFVLASTSEVYGDPLVNPQPESYWGHVNQVGPRGVYDEAKRFAEALTVAYRQRYGVDTAVARLFNTFGPRMRPDDGRAVPAFVQQALRGEPLTVAGDGRQTRSMCYVDDLIEGVFRLLGSDHPGPMNLGNPHELPIVDLARRIIALTGSPSTVTLVPRPIDDPRVRCPDITLARTVLRWEPTVELDRGLRRTIDWFRRHLDHPAPQPAGDHKGAR